MGSDELTANGNDLGGFERSFHLPTWKVVRGGAHDQPAVGAPQDVVSHDTEPAVQRLSLTCRPWLDDVEHPEHEKTGGGAEDADVQQLNGDELPGNLIDDDMARIFAAEVLR